MPKECSGWRTSRAYVSLTVLTPSAVSTASPSMLGHRPARRNTSPSGKELPTWR